ncbi:MAG: glutaredoxin family protein [Gaiellaceae bacterium]
MRTTTDTLILVTGRDCHLCEHGRQVLAGLDVRTREIDVDGDEAASLAARGVALAFLPVLTDGVRVLGYGRLSERRLRKELAL